MNVSIQPFCTSIFVRRILFLSFSLLLTLALASTASAQKKKKKDDQQSTPNPAMQLPDEQKIDAHYADDMDAVNGMWAPPVVGWPNYLASYQSQRARTQQVRLDRSNTLIRLAPGGNTAWACYQWEFTALVDGVPTTAFGHTTLVLEKRNDAWLIVHNHTSLVQSSQAAAPQPQSPPATPTKP